MAKEVFHLETSESFRSIAEFKTSTNTSFYILHFKRQNCLQSFKKKNNWTIKFLNEFYLWVSLTHREGFLLPCNVSVPVTPIIEKFFLLTVIDPHDFPASGLDDVLQLTQLIHSFKGEPLQNNIKETISLFIERSKHKSTRRSTENVVGGQWNYHTPKKKWLRCLIYPSHV